MGDSKDSAKCIINKYIRKRGLNGSVTEEESLIVQGEVMSDVAKEFDKRWGTEDGNNK